MLVYQRVNSTKHRGAILLVELQPQVLHPPPLLTLHREWRSCSNSWSSTPASAWCYLLRTVVGRDLSDLSSKRSACPSWNRNQTGLMLTQLNSWRMNHKQSIGLFEPYTWKRHATTRHNVRSISSFYLSNGQGTRRWCAWWSRK